MLLTYFVRSAKPPSIGQNYNIFALQLFDLESEINF